MPCPDSCDHFDARGEGLDNILTTASVISNAGEDPSESKMMDNPIPDIFYDASNLPPDDEIFQDKHHNTDGLYYFDPSDLDHITDFVGHAFYLTLDPDDVIDSHDVNKFLFMLDHDELRGAHKPLTHSHMSHELRYKIMLTSMSNIWDTDRLISSGRH